MAVKPIAVPVADSDSVAAKNAAAENTWAFGRATVLNRATIP